MIEEEKNLPFLSCDNRSSTVILLQNSASPCRQEICLQNILVAFHMIKKNNKKKKKKKLYCVNLYLLTSRSLYRKIAIYKNFGVVHSVFNLLLQFHLALTSQYAQHHSTFDLKIKIKILHMGNTMPSCMCVIQEYQFFTMSSSQYHLC